MTTYKINIEDFNEGCTSGNFGGLQEVDAELYDYVEVNIDSGRVTFWGIKNGSAELWDDNGTADTDFLDGCAFEIEKSTTKEDVLKNLQELIGTEFDADEVICAFEDFEEDGEDSVYVGESHNNGYDAIAYINTANSTQFLFKLDDNIITDIEMYEP